VRVRFAGPGREFIDLAVRKPSLVLRIAEVQDTEQAFELVPSMVRLPDGLEVNAYDVDPAFARLRFRQLARREIPVGITIDTTRAAAWTLVGPLRVTPTRVRVSGPLDRVPALRSVATVAIPIPARDGAFDEEVALDLEPLRGLEISTRTVRVAGRSERVVTRRIPAVPVTFGGGLQLAPEAVEVHLRGGRSAVEAVAPEALRVVLAIDSIPGQVPPGGHAVPVRIEGVDGRIRASTSPATVHLLPAAGALADSASAAAALSDDGTGQ